MKCLRYETIHSLKSRDFSLVQHHNAKNFYLYLKIIQTLTPYTQPLFTGDAANDE